MGRWRRMAISGPLLAETWKSLDRPESEVCITCLFFQLMQTSNVIGASISLAVGDRSRRLDQIPGSITRNPNRIAPGAVGPREARGNGFESGLLRCIIW